MPNYGLALQNKPCRVCNIFSLHTIFVNLWFPLSLQRARALLSLFTLGSAAYVLIKTIDWQSKFAHFQWWPQG